VNSEVLNLKFFFIVSSLSEVQVDSVANFGWARTTNIGLLYPKIWNNIGRYSHWRPPNQNIGGDVSPASPVGLTILYYTLSKESTSNRTWAGRKDYNSNETQKRVKRKKVNTKKLT